MLKLQKSIVTHIDVLPYSCYINSKRCKAESDTNMILIQSF